MYFEYPSVLLGLWILPLLAWLLYRAQRKRLAAAARFADPAMTARLMPSLGGARPWIKGAALLAALACLIVAAARPKFGVFYEKSVQRGVDVLIALDVSRSMLANDVAENRLQRAKSDILDLLRKTEGDRVGLVVFAGKASLKVPLTDDLGFLRMVLKQVEPHSAPRGGSLIGDAIRKCLEVMPPRHDRDQAIVLITDGEDQQSEPMAAAAEAARRGVKIFTVGLGDDREGSRIPLRDNQGNLSYLKTDDGREHWSKVDQQLLGQIALATGGVHVAAGTKAYDLGEVFEDNLAHLTQGEAESTGIRRRYRERFQVFIGLALVLLLVDLGTARSHPAPAVSEASP